MSQIFMLEKEGDTYRVCYWLAVPAALQDKLANPNATSQFRGATQSQMTSLRSGQTLEVVEKLSSAGQTQGQLDTAMQARRTALQGELDSSDLLANYGRFFNGTIWSAGGTPPPTAQRDENLLPTFFVNTPVSGFAANRFHFVTWNNTNFYDLRVLLIVHQPIPTVVTGAAPSPFELRRRIGATTNPSGGAVTPVGLFSGGAMPAGISFHNQPTTVPAGGTTGLLMTYQPQADEIKLSTLDAPTFASLQPFAGVAIYDANRFRPARPIIVRPGEILEIQQGATAGTGNCRLLVIVAVEDNR